MPAAPKKSADVLLDGLTPAGFFVIAAAHRLFYRYILAVDFHSPVATAPIRLATPRGAPSRRAPARLQSCPLQRQGLAGAVLD